LVENKTEEKEMTAEEERAYQARVAAAMEAMQEEEEEGEEARAARLAEERRKRREAIMAKHAAAKQTSVRVDADENAKDANAALPGGAATGPAVGDAPRA
jgi:hypothetical protein